MADNVVELIFRAIAQDNASPQFARINEAVKKIASDSGLTGQALTNLEATVRKNFENMSAAGLNFDQIVKRIAQSGDTIGRGVAGSAREIQKGLKDAADAAKNLADQQKSLQSASAGLQGAIANPFTSLSNAAASAAAALGPVGLAIVGISTVATLGAKAMFDLVDSQGKAAQATVNMAAQLGISAGEMKRLQVEANLIGVSFQSMQIAARQLAVGLEEPTGAGKRAAQTLRDLGVATQLASGEVRQEGEVFTDVLGKLAGIEDHTQRVEEATRLFGSRSSAAILLLIGRYKELDETARSLGYGDTTKLQEALAKGEEKINAMSAAWDLFKAKLAEKISPVVIPIVAGFTKELTGDYRGTRERGRFGFAGDTANENAADDLLTQGLRRSTDALIGNAGRTAFAQENAGYAADLAGGKAIADRANASFDRTPEGLSARIKELNDTIKEDRDKLARGGLGTDAAAQIASGLATAESQKASAEAQRKALEEAARHAEEIQRHFAKIEEDLKQGIGAPENLRKAQAALNENLSQAGGNARYRQDAQSLFTDQTSRYIDELAAKDQDSAAKKLRENAEKIAKSLEKLGEEFDKETARIQETEQKLQYDTARKLSDIDTRQTRSLDNLNRDSVHARARQQGGYGEVAADYQANVEDALANKTASLSDLAALQKDIEARVNTTVQEQLDAEKELADLTVKRKQTESDYTVAIAKAQMDAANELAALQKQQLDSYKQQAGQIFDAIRQPGGRGLQQYFRGQANDLARGVFSNATAPVLQQIGQSVAGSTSGLPPEIQALFKGTVLDSSRSGKTPQIVAVDANTTAINANTAALTGKTVAGQSPDAAPGSIASSVERVAGIGGGATPPFLSSGGSAGTASTPGAFAQLLKGLTGGIGNWGEIFHGDTTTTDADGNTTTTAVSPWQQAGAAAGTLATAGAGIYEGINQIGKGGESGILGGIGALSGTAAALDPDPISKTILSLTSVFSELFKGLLPDPVTQREAQIANQEGYSTYVAPPTLNRNLSASGGFEQVNNKYGLPSATTFTSVAIEQPTKYESPIQDPSGLYQNWQTAPGQVIEPYQAAAANPSYVTNSNQPGVTFVLNAHAVDMESFISAGPKIASSLQKQILEGHPVANALARAVLGS